LGIRSLTKFAKRRKSIEYRTDFPIFRPSIIDMIWDARNRLLSFKQSTVHSGNQGSVLLSEQVLAGAGRCLVPISDVDRAIDAYTQFIHRYALHVSVFEVTSFCLSYFIVLSGIALYDCNSRHNETKPRNGCQCSWNWPFWYWWR
jgi:hypothetical protein